MLTWLLRAVGVFVMFIGFALVLFPLSVIADFVPFIGSIVGAGALLVALVCTFVLAPALIAVAWLWYRPLISVAVLAVGLGVAYGFPRWRRAELRHARKRLNGLGTSKCRVGK